MSLYKKGPYSKQQEQESIIPPPKGLEDSGTFWRSPDEAGLYKFGPHVKVNFDDVFEESLDYQESSLGQTLGTKVNHGCLKAIFDSCNHGVFYILSLLCGWVSALCCGLAYGVNMTLVVWVVQPAIKILFTWFRLCFASNRACMRACCDPCCQSMGQSLAFIRGKVLAEVAGLNFDTTATTYNYNTDKKDKEAAADEK